MQQVERAPARAAGRVLPDALRRGVGGARVRRRAPCWARSGPRRSGWRPSTPAQTGAVGPGRRPGARADLDGRPCRCCLADSPGAVQGPRHLPDADRAEILAELEHHRQPLHRRPRSSPSGGRAQTAPPSPARCRRRYGAQRLGVGDSCTSRWPAGPRSHPGASPGRPAARLLAEFGADVVKINGPQRRIGSHGYLNRGKRTHPAGHRVAARASRCSGSWSSRPTS